VALLENGNGERRTKMFDVSDNSVIGFYARQRRQSKALNNVLSQDQGQLLVIQDEVSGWADFGNPVRVIETLIRNRIAPSWLRKMRDVPRLFEEITGIG
jgi:hypothetical protein